MKGYTIDISNYEHDTYVEKAGEPPTKRSDTVYVRFSLPRVLCDPNFSKTPGQMDPAFDLYEIGNVAKLIEHCKQDEITLDQKHYDLLKARIAVISKYLGYPYFEIVRRINEAKTVECEAKK